MSHIDSTVVVFCLKTNLILCHKRLSKKVPNLNPFGISRMMKLIILITSQIIDSQKYWELCKGSLAFFIIINLLIYLLKTSLQGLSCYFKACFYRFRSSQATSLRSCHFLRDLINPAVPGSSPIPSRLLPDHCSPVVPFSEFHPLDVTILLQPLFFLFSPEYSRTPPSSTWPCRVACSVYIFSSHPFPQPGCWIQELDSTSTSPRRNHSTNNSWMPSWCCSKNQGILVTFLGFVYHHTR